MPDLPLFTLTAIGDEPNSRLVMEPNGGEYELPPGQRLRIDVYGAASVGLDDFDGDVTIEHSPGRLTLRVASNDFRIWNEAGTEITDQAL